MVLYRTKEVQYVASTFLLFMSKHWTSIFVFIWFRANNTQLGSAKSIDRLKIEANEILTRALQMRGRLVLMAEKRLRRADLASTVGKGLESVSTTREPPHHRDDKESIEPQVSPHGSRIRLDDWNATDVRRRRRNSRLSNMDVELNDNQRRRRSASEIIDPHDDIQPNFQSLNHALSIVIASHTRDRLFTIIETQMELPYDGIFNDSGFFSGSKTEDTADSIEGSILEVPENVATVAVQPVSNEE